MEAAVANDRNRVLLPFGAGALATISVASSPDSDDPSADDASVSSGCSEMRYDKAILGPGYFTREDFLDYYGYNGIARWERATVYDSDASSDSSSCPETERRYDEAIGFGLRHDKATLGPGYFSRDDFLNY